MPRHNLEMQVGVAETAPNVVALGLPSTEMTIATLTTIGLFLPLHGKEEAVILLPRL